MNEYTHAPAQTKRVNMNKHDDTLACVDINIHTI